MDRQKWIGPSDFVIWFDTNLENVFAAGSEYLETAISKFLDPSVLDPIRWIFLSRIINGQSSQQPHYFREGSLENGSDRPTFWIPQSRFWIRFGSDALDLLSKMISDIGFGSVLDPFWIRFKIVREWLESHYPRDNRFGSVLDPQICIWKFKLPHTRFWIGPSGFEYLVRYRDLVFGSDSELTGLSNTLSAIGG